MSVALVLSGGGAKGAFTVGVLLVPSLTSSIFSGHSGESALPDRIHVF